MSGHTFLHLGSVHSVEAFELYLRENQITIPCDKEILTRGASPLAQPLRRGGIRIGNRFAIHPMEGWDGTVDGRISELTLRRWQNFGRSGAKLIWGGEAVAVRHDGRANPNQLLIREDEGQNDLSRLRD